MSDLINSASPTLPEIPDGYLNIMGYVDESEVNGPGTRAVVWVQGCLRECSGCFNPESWPFEVNQLMAIDELADKILSNPRNQGVTFSGGEPFWQAPALAELGKKNQGSGIKSDVLYRIYLGGIAVTLCATGCGGLIRPTRHPN